MTNTAITTNKNTMKGGDSTLKYVLNVYRKVLVETGQAVNLGNASKALLLEIQRSPKAINDVRETLDNVFSSGVVRHITYNEAKEVRETVKIKVTNNRIYSEIPEKFLVQETNGYKWLALGSKEAEELHEILTNFNYKKASDETIMQVLHILAYFTRTDSELVIDATKSPDALFIPCLDQLSQIKCLSEKKSLYKAQLDIDTKVAKVAIDSNIDLPLSGRKVNKDGTQNFTLWDEMHRIKSDATKVVNNKFSAVIDNINIDDELIINKAAEYVNTYAGKGGDGSKSVKADMEFVKSIINCFRDLESVKSKEIDNLKGNLGLKSEELERAQRLIKKEFSRYIANLQENVSFYFQDKPIVYAFSVFLVTAKQFGGTGNPAFRLMPKHGIAFCLHLAKQLGFNSCTDVKLNVRFIDEAILESTKDINVVSEGSFDQIREAELNALEESQVTLFFENGVAKDNNGNVIAELVSPYTGNVAVGVHRVTYNHKYNQYLTLVNKEGNDWVADEDTLAAMHDRAINTSVSAWVPISDYYKFQEIKDSGKRVITTSSLDASQEAYDTLQKLAKRTLGERVFLGQFFEAKNNSGEVVKTNNPIVVYSKQAKTCYVVGEYKTFSSKVEKGDHNPFVNFYGCHSGIVTNFKFVESINKDGKKYMRLILFVEDIEKDGKAIHKINKVGCKLSPSLEAYHVARREGKLTEAKKTAETTKQEKQADSLTKKIEQVSQVELKQQSASV